MRVDQRRRVWGLLVGLVGIGIVGLVSQAYGKAESAIHESQLSAYLAALEPSEAAAAEVSVDVSSASPEGVSGRFASEFVEQVRPLYSIKLEWWGPDGEFDAEDYERFVGTMMVLLGVFGGGVALFGFYNFRRRSDQL